MDPFRKASNTADAAGDSGSGIGAFGVVVMVGPPVGNEFDASDFGIGLQEIAVWQFQVVRVMRGFIHYQSTPIRVTKLS
jgi:hypothetical protein